MTSLTINIIGSGSIGHLWTAYLLNNSAHVSLYSKHSQPIQKYKLISPEYSFTYRTSYKSLNNWQHAEIIMISVKATALEELCLKLKALKIRNSPILLMMNGLGLAEIVKKHLPKHLILQAATTHGARLEKQTLHHTGSGETLIGSMLFKGDKLENNTLVNLLIEQLNKALPTTAWNTHHHETLWLKLFINAIINPLTAIYNINNGEIVNNQPVNQQAKKLTQQLSPLIERYLPKQTWQSVFEKVESIANQTYTNVSSMRQDILLCRKTEIDYISGYLVEVAKKHHVTLFEHEQIIKQIKILESKNK